MSQERLAASLDIDRCTSGEIVRIIQEQDRLVAEAVAAAAAPIAEAIEQVAARLAHGGRLVYAGAGTSGRIALLDAAELPPTYGVDPGLVRVLLAGGERAFTQSVEGAEDAEEAAAAAVAAHVTAGDALVGIAASGTTPYTVAAVRRANQLGALTVGVTSAPGSPLAHEARIAIVADTGPEVIMGSTRMKSGTAQKLILNTLSTGVMIRLGHVYSNLMIDMPATNEKLRRRAVRMVELAADVPQEEAMRALRDTEGNVRLAVVMAKQKLSRDEAERALARHGGNLRQVLREVLGS
jgi:N-acetylmuramic acid 6-phosphate etherase